MKAICVLLAATAAAVPALVVGQPAAPASNPADPQASTAPARYESAFSEYRPYSEPEVANWREINDQVRAAAGQSGHFGHGAADHSSMHGGMGAAAAGAKPPSVSATGPRGR